MGTIISTSTLVLYLRALEPLMTKASNAGPIAVIAAHKGTSNLPLILLTFRVHAREG